MANWQQVNVRVRESTYEEWREAAESEYGGLSDLVRTAVRRELEGHHTAESGEQTASSGETVNEVAESVDRLENTVRDMDTRLKAVKESVESTGLSVKAAVRETLPAVPESARVPDEEGKGKHIADPSIPQAPEPDEWALTATNIAARLNADETAVQNALDELIVELPYVEPLEHDGETFYFRSED